MGLQNREYFQSDSDNRWRGQSPEWPVCKKLLIVTVAVFALQILSTRDASSIEESRRTGPRISVVQNWLQLETGKVQQGQVWRLLTYAFCHDRISPMHILFNMLGLWWFGRTLESMYGSREFLWFYLVAAVLSGIAYVGLDLITGQGSAAIGASGSVMAVLCLYAWHFPRQIIQVFFVFPVEIRWVVTLYAIFDFFPVLQQLRGQPGNDGIAHAAHAGGLLFGFFYGRQQWSLTSRFRGGSMQMPRWKSLFRRKPKLRIRTSEELATYQHNSSRLDDLLAKISEQGEESLTADERQFLIRESERLKRRG